MKLRLLLWLLGFAIFSEVESHAHIGSPNVFFEGRAGEYPVRVVIRPPQVVPGLAEISVRTGVEPIKRVAVLPVFWRAGRKGAPPPDEAELVRGETNLYTASLWLMKLGAYSVEVTVEGARGTGTLVVPVNSIATNTRPMSRTHTIILSLLALVLIVWGIKIAEATFGQSLLAPGVSAAKADRRRGGLAMVLTAIALVLLLYGGKKWWDYEDSNYRNNSLYQPFPVRAQVNVERDQPVLSLRVEPPNDRRRWAPLIPDHGKMMHLFLVRAEAPGAFAHLHPVLRGDAQFAAPLPPLPAGRYHLYADVTHEDGFSETLTATADLPTPSPRMKQLWLGASPEPICTAAVAQMLATNLVFPPDPDDSWQMDDPPGAAGSLRSRDAVPRVSPSGTIASVEVGGGYKMVWEQPGELTEQADVSLRFKLFTLENRPAQLESYMGMAGHLALRREDGSVFAHVHPQGSFSMAAQEFFERSDQGAPATNASGGKATSAPSRASSAHAGHSDGGLAVGELAFPYAFPRPGRYRLWVQAKSGGRIFTAVFDRSVVAAK